MLAATMPAAPRRRKVTKWSGSLAAEKAGNFLSSRPETALTTTPCALHSGAILNRFFEEIHGGNPASGTTRATAFTTPDGLSLAGDHGDLDRASRHRARALGRHACAVLVADSRGERTGRIQRI